MSQYQWYRPRVLWGHWGGCTQPFLSAVRGCRVIVASLGWLGWLAGLGWAGLGWAGLAERLPGAELAPEEAGGRPGK